MIHDLPVIDLEGLDAHATPMARSAVVGALRDACEQHGAFYVGGDPPEVSSTLRTELLEHTQRLFALTPDVKQRYHVRNSPNHRGYVPPGEERYGVAGHVPHDAKEAWDLSLELPSDDPEVLAGTPMTGPNVWPSEVPGFREAVGGYYAGALALGHRILDGFTEALGLETGSLARYVKKPQSQLRLLHYPPRGQHRPAEASGAPPSGERLGLSPHTDFEVFTIQLTTGPGLEIQDRAGHWHPAPPCASGLTVFLGDLMETWTNGRWRATPHRVVATPFRRYAFPLFFTVDFATRVEPLPSFVDDSHPPAYPAVVAGEHLWRRTCEAFAYLGASPASP